MFAASVLCFLTYILYDKFEKIANLRKNKKDAIKDVFLLVKFGKFSNSFLIMKYARVCARVIIS